MMLADLPIARYRLTARWRATRLPDRQAAPPDLPPHPIAARAAQAAAEQVAAEQRARALQALSPNLQAVETLRHQCEELLQKIAGGNFRKQLPDAGRAGLYQDASRLAKAALEAADWNAPEKAALADMLEQYLPQVISPWDAKEQRKKLRFAVLRGQS